MLSNKREISEKTLYVAVYIECDKPHRTKSKDTVNDKALKPCKKLHWYDSVGASHRH